MATIGVELDFTRRIRASIPRHRSPDSAAFAINVNKRNMSVKQRFWGSSLGKKYLMAISGFILTGFVIGHMLGNLQMFLHPDWINTYAHQLQNLPYGLLWVVRLVLVAAVGIHIWSAILLTLENRRARPHGYEVEESLQASYASRTMIYSGAIIAIFIVFHILHYTTLSVFDYSMLYNYRLEGVGEPVLNVYAMLYIGFSKWYVAVFYIVAVFLLCQHLGHGISSMFQSIGWRNQLWRRRLDRIALVIGWALFIGFAIIPAAVMLDAFAGVPIFDRSSFEELLGYAIADGAAVEGGQYV